MRHIFTVSLDAELEKRIDGYQEENGFETRSEGAIQLMKKGLRYDNDISGLQKEITQLKNRPNEINLPCSVCGEPMNIRESDDDPIYKEMKTKFKNWGHSSCIAAEKSGK